MRVKRFWPVHYNNGRTNWRSDCGHPRDQSFKLADWPARGLATYFIPAIHQHEPVAFNEEHVQVCIKLGHKNDDFLTV